MKRKHMPNRYRTERQGVKVGGRTLYVDVGKDHEGMMRVLFIDTYKTGSEQRALMEVVSRLISLGLQYDVPLGKITHMLRGTKFSPKGIVTGDDKVKFASSPLDYVAKHLAEVDS